jgi:hypothetical protein
MKRKFNINLALAIILLLIALAMAGLFSWATAGFRPDPLNDEKFWFSLIISVIINLFSLMSSITYQLPQELENNNNILEKKKALLDFNISIDPNKLEEFIIEANLKRKRSVFLTKLENDRKAFIKKFKPTLLDRKTWQSGSKEDKDKNEYCLKLMEYEYQKSEDYLKENLIYMEIKYPEITTGMIISDSMARENGLGYIHSEFEKSKWWILKTVPNYLINMSLAVAWATFFIEMTDKLDTLFWLDFAVRLVGMLLNISTGLFLVSNYIRTIVIGDLDFRLSLARQFIVWQKNIDNNIPKSEL